MHETAGRVYRADGGVIHDELRGPRRRGRQARTRLAPEPPGYGRGLGETIQDCGEFMFVRGGFAMRHACGQ